MLRQIVLHTFSSGIYTMPLPSCLHLHIYIALSPPPTVLQCSRQLICWPPSEAALMAGQRIAAKKNNLLQECSCACAGVYLYAEFNKHSHSHAWAAYLLFILILWKVFALKSAKEMYIQKFHYKKVSNIRVLTKCRVLWVRGCERIPGSSLHDLEVWCMCVFHRCFYVLHSLSQAAQFTELNIQSLNFLSFINWFM